MMKPHLVALLLVSLLAGCATTTSLPPISADSTERKNPGQVIWHDLATRDLEIAKAFYGQLLGWSFSESTSGPRKYTLIRHRGQVIGGMFLFESGEKDSPHGEWLLNFSTDDTDAAAAAFAAAGGRIIEPPRAFPDRGRGAFVEDPQGALLILMDSSSGDPEESEVPIGGWLWNELWTSDREAALQLYTDVFGYASQPVEEGVQRDYSLLTKGEAPQGGILQMQTDEVRPHWVPFIRVESVASIVAVAKAMQANVILEPDPNIRDGKVALLQGPTGEPFVVQEYDFN